MTTSHHLWDRAAALVAVDGRRFPELAALPTGVPSVNQLFDFMRDAELRFETLRMRILEVSQAAHGEQAVETVVVMRHPGHARVTSSQPGAGRTGDYEIWIADGDIVRTYASKHKLGTQRPIRNRPRGLDDPDLPGSAKVYEPLTALPFETLPETFVHPAGYCQNVLATGECVVTGQEVIRGRETIEMAADRPDFAVQIAVDRDTGIIVRLTETTSAGTSRNAEVVDLETDPVLQPTTFDFVFPTGTTMLY